MTNATENCSEDLNKIFLRYQQVKYPHFEIKSKLNALWCEMKRLTNTSETLFRITAIVIMVIRDSAGEQELIHIAKMRCIERYLDACAYWNIYYGVNDIAAYTDLTCISSSIFTGLASCPCLIIRKSVIQKCNHNNRISHMQTRYVGWKSSPGLSFQHPFLKYPQRVSDLQMNCSNLTSDRAAWFSPTSGHQDDMPYSPKLLHIWPLHVIYGMFIVCWARSTVL